MSASDAGGDFADALLRWFASEHRDLPWRRERSDYAVAVSEVMLQQTTVAAAAPRFERFLSRFPDWSALAAAEPDEVLAEWAGLGYYRRARNLHAMARSVVDDHSGRFPTELGDARALPGVGHYTAGAILSLAHGVATPAVDGNVARVLSRVLGRSLDPSRAVDRRALEQAVLERMPADAPGAFNEALIELGATTCTPREPHCPACPVAPGCEARRLGLQEDVPARRKTSWKAVTAVAAVVSRGEEVLLVRRPDDASRLAGLWELPGTWCESDETPPAALERRVLVAHGGGDVGKAIGTVRHVITNHRIEMHVLRCTLARRPRTSATRRWGEPAALAGEAGPLALTTATRRALRLLHAR